MDHDTQAIQRYQQRIHKVLQYIDAHLDQPLDLETLADQAHFSAFHFHRLFAALMGERIGDYVRRRRLEIAALRLCANPQSSVLELALAVGFGSAEAFSRAFKERFGNSPTSWRRQQRQARQAQGQSADLENSKNNQIDSKPDHSKELGLLQNVLQQSLHRINSMQVAIVQRPTVKIAYLRHVGAYGTALGQFWRQQVTPWMAQQGLLQRDCFGISHDDPSICEPALCRYDAAVLVDADFQALAPALVTELPGGWYAAMDFFGRSEEIGAVWDQLLRDWLPASGYQLAARPCFEFYPANGRFDANTGAFACQIMLPVVVP